MPGISVEKLVKDWGSVRAVDNVTFATKPAEFVALLGPSGCGKSTTLRLIAGLEGASSGRIRIAGADVTNLPPSKRNVSMVFQSYALFPHLTVEHNILFGLSVRHVPRPEKRRRLTAVADLLGLADLLHRRPSQLSGGQQQRVALGRALISEKPVCLLDEPLSNLDAQLRAEMRSEIRALQRRLALTVVFVTHDQTEAMSMADRVMLMRDGLVEQSGTPAELYERPASVFVARFIGTPPMNVLELAPDGTIAGGPGTAVVAAGGNGLKLGLRPEEIALAASGQPAVVETSEYYGADSVIACCIGAQRLLVRVPGRPNAEPGGTIHLSWRSSAAHLFNSTTGLRQDGLPQLPAMPAG